MDSDKDDMDDMDCMRVYIVTTMQSNLQVWVSDNAAAADPTD